MAGRPKNVTTLTPEPGRRVGRGLKHGLYTDRVIVLGESRADFDGLRVGLVDSLKPVGAYEHALVDKAAFCLWRNVRLARAEWAAAEKALLPDNLARDAGFVDQNAAAAVDWTERKPAPGDGERAAAVVAEIDAAPDDCEPLEYFPKHAPTLWAALCAEARGDAPAVVSSYVYREYGGWETLLESWRQEAADAVASPISPEQAAHLVEIVLGRAVLSLTKFLDMQEKLDRQLRTVMRELREQQRHRLETGASVVSEQGES